MKFFKTILTVAVIAAVGVGGYMLYTNVIAKQSGEFELTYKVWENPLDKDVKRGECTGYKGVAIENVVVPESAEISGKNYYIGRISSNAFANNKTMKTLDLPSVMTYYGSNIVKGCEALESITIRTSYSDGFALVFEGIDLSKVTFTVGYADMKTQLLNSYSEANVVVDASIATI